MVRRDDRHFYNGMSVSMPGDLMDYIGLGSAFGKPFMDKKSGQLSSLACLNDGDDGVDGDETDVVDHAWSFKEIAQLLRDHPDAFFVEEK